MSSPTMIKMFGFFSAPQTVEKELNAMIVKNEDLRRSNLIIEAESQFRGEKARRSCHKFGALRRFGLGYWPGSPCQGRTDPPGDRNLGLLFNIKVLAVAHFCEPCN